MAKKRAKRVPQPPRMQIVGVEARSAAQQIAERLFRNYDGKQVERLVLVNDQPKAEFGGWGFVPAIDNIEDVLLGIGIPLRVVPA